MVELDFGFVFSRVCLHYGMAYAELMRLPVKTFWMLNKNVSRLLAETDLRRLSLTAAAQSADAAASHSERLIAELDSPYVFENVPVLDAERDEVGFAELKLMSM